MGYLWLIEIIGMMDRMLSYKHQTMLREKVKCAHYLLIIRKKSDAIALKWEVGDQKLEFVKY